MPGESNASIDLVANSAKPVQTKERIEFVDIIRGFALLGVYIANMVAFSGQRPGVLVWPGNADRAVVVLIEFLVRAKFYTMFSFLFGWGMAIHLERSAAKGTKFLPVYLRRLVILLIVGLIHGLLIWRGDILTIYVLFGFLLILFRKRSPNLLLAFSILLLVFNIALNLPVESIAAFREGYNQFVSNLQWNTYPEALYNRGTYWEITLFRVQEFIGGNLNLLYFIGPVFSMFLLGLYTGKRRIFQEIDQRLRLVRVTMWSGLVIGLSLNGLFAATRVWAEPGWPAWLDPTYYRAFTIATRTIGAPALMLFYVSALILLSRNPIWRGRLSSLGSVGQMALTNYLFQSIISTLIFYNYGLGTYGEFGPFAALMLTLIVFWIQIQFSVWWMDRYQFGPFEWLWRTLTYGRRQPLVHGETYQSIDPHIFPAWIRRIDSRKVLAGVWVILILWSGTLGYYYLNLDILDPSALLGDQFSETSTGSQLSFDGTGGLTGDNQSGFPVAVVPPEVNLVPFNPGPIAASGDLIALADTFDSQSAFAQIQALTGPLYLGRYAGSPQGQAAGDYIADQFAALGLQPVGDQGTFFQSFPVEYIRLENIPSLTVTDSYGFPTNYTYTQDFSVINSAYLGEGAAQGQVVWANKCQHEDFDTIDALGKIVFCRPENYSEAGRNAIEHGAAALLILSSEGENSRPLDFAVPYRDTWVPDTIPGIIVSPQVASALLEGSGKTVQDLTLQFISFPLQSSVKIQVDIIATEEVCGSDECVARNVLGVIPGRSPETTGEVLVIGAHYDHLGQSPDNSIAWLGANDNASGVAVMLEIARAWQEQGYVPNRTVLFAAWDAEELGLVGSRYYVRNPKYPLTETVAVLNLDMVGYGSDSLRISGSAPLGSYFQDIAARYGLSSELSETSRSDHASFIEFGIPAAMLSWGSDQNTDVQYHRPGDTPEIIQLEKLDQIGKIAYTAVLGLTEGEPEILALIESREQAILTEDLNAFLATSLPGNSSYDRAWFQDLDDYDLVNFSVAVENVQVVGESASASITYHLEFPDPGTGAGSDGSDSIETIVTSMQLAVRFEKIAGAWKWAGPDLKSSDSLPPPEDQTEASPADRIQIEFPGEHADDLIGVSEELAAHYQTIADLLNFPSQPDAALLLYPSSNSLRADTALSLSPSTFYWINDGVVKWVYPNAIGEDGIQKTLAAQLILAEAGIPGDIAPWLWEGLAAEVEADQNYQEVQQTHLDALIRTLNADSLSENEAASWAKVQYLRQRLGWSGLGRFIDLLGQICRTSGCEDGVGLDAAFQQTLGVDYAGFESLWQNAWQQKLDTAQAALDQVLEQRVNAVLISDSQAFLATVDSGIPNLNIEQNNWLSSLNQFPAGSFSLSGKPVVLFDDGSMIAEVRMLYQLESLDNQWAAGNSTNRIYFTPQGANLRWAGAPFEELRGQTIIVLYPLGFEELAQSILDQAESIYPDLARGLGFSRSGRITLKLYEGREDFRTSISLAQPFVDWLTGRTARNESIKLRIQPGQEAADYTGEIVQQMSRYLMVNQNITEEWFLKGMAAYQAIQFGGADLQGTATSFLRRLTIRIGNDTLVGLDQIEADDQLDENDWGLSTAYTWDVIRFINFTYGEAALQNLTRQFTRGLTTEQAIQAVFGQSREQFQQDWTTSLYQSHAEAGWVDLANSFDVQEALAHIQTLTQPEMAGRQAGTRGEHLAAGYIADKFSEYGLIPIVESNHSDLQPGIYFELFNEETEEDPVDAASELDPVPSGPSYFQFFPIELSELIASPQLTFYDDQGTKLPTFGYRADYKLAVGPTFKGGYAEGQLVWVPGRYQDFNLTGKIVARIQADSIENEMKAAIDAGASGLILIRETEFTRVRDLQEKVPFPTSFEDTPSIPVVLMGPDGYERLREAIDLSRPELTNAPPALPLDIQVRFSVPMSTPAQSVSANIIGLLPGTDPALRDEYILIGAHYDHVGDDPDLLLCNGEQITDPSRFNQETCERLPGLKYAGANDNASGIATLLEIARIFHETGFQSNRSILFIAWGAEEAGQIGSRYFVENPAAPLESIKSVIQLDSLGGGDGYYLLATGTWDAEGNMLYGIYAGNEIFDKRLTISSTLILSDQAPFRTKGIPGLLISWDRATDPVNWPDIEAPEVLPERLEISGILSTFALLTLTH